MSTNRTTIEAYFSAINEERWDDFRALLTDDAKYQTVGGRPRQGADEVVEYFKGLFKAWSAHYDDPQVIIVDGDHAAAEVRFRGTSVAGLPIEFDAVDTFELRDGKLARWATWYDLPGVRAALQGTP